MERFLLEQAPHIPLLLPFFEWPDVGYLSSTSRNLAASLLRDLFFRHARVVVPGYAATNDVIYRILAQLSPLARHVALANPTYLPLLYRLPLLNTLRIATPTVLLLDESVDDVPPICLDRNAIASLERLGGVVHLELDARVDDLDRLCRSMTQLQSLELVFRARIDSLAPLAALRHLGALTLQCETIDNIDAIGQLSQLVSLALSSWGVHDISALGSLVHLERLDLRRCNVVDLAPLRGLRSLRCLRLDETPVADLWPLGELDDLQFLSLARSQASDLTPLGACAASLHFLDLSGCTLVRVAALLRLQRLECLRLQNTTWSSLGVEPTVSATLASLQHLRAVDGRVNSIVSLHAQGIHTRLELAALQRMGSLESLELTGDSLSGTTQPLALPHLVWLRVEWSYANEHDVPLATVVHPRLRVLHLVRVRLRSLANLRYAPQLRELRLVDVITDDLSMLRYAANLTHFEHTCVMVHTREQDLDDSDPDDAQPFDRAPRHDLTALGALAHLRYLDLSYTSIRNVQPLQFLEKLRHVDLSNTDIQDVSPLRTLQLLECIRLGDTEIAHFDGGAFSRVLVELALPAHVDCRAIRLVAPHLKRLLHPDRDCLWSGHATRPTHLDREATARMGVTVDTE